MPEEISELAKRLSEVEQKYETLSRLLELPQVLEILSEQINDFTSQINELRMSVQPPA